MIALKRRERKLPMARARWECRARIRRRGARAEVCDWLFSAIDPIFDDFKKQFGSTRETYELYGHSAGGGFVHFVLLMVPDAKIDHAVAANPPSYTMPDADVAYPFGL